MPQSVPRARWLAISDRLDSLPEALKFADDERWGFTRPRTGVSLWSMGQGNARTHSPLTLVTSTSSASHASKARRCDEPIERALALMRADLSAAWTVTSLARRVGLSRPVFAKRFRQYVGQSPMRHLARVRMQRAKELLAEREMNLAHVASRIGYVSEFAFNRAFKRAFGIAPGTLRKSAHGAPVFRMAA